MNQDSTSSPARVYRCRATHTPNTATRRMRRKRAKSNGISSDGEWQWCTPWLDSLGMTEYESNEQRLHDEIVAYVNFLALTEHESRARALVISKAEELVRRRLATCEIEVFGSVALDLCLPDSDIDMVVKTPLIYNDKYKIRTLFQLSSMMKGAMFCCNVSVATGARDPIFHLETLPMLGSFNMDISVNADEGVETTLILKAYLSSLPPLRHLLLVLKGFLHRRGLHSASNGGLNSYALSCMVICFLKLNPLKRPDGFLTNIMENESLGTLVVDFFDFYGEKFDWTASCISPVRGEIVSKESMGYVNDNFREALSIDCLVHPGRDIGRSASRATQIKDAFREAHHAISIYRMSVTNNNVLGTVVSISRKVFDHRKRIRHLIDSGELEASLMSLQLPAAWTAPASGQQDRHRGSRSQRHDPSHSGGNYSYPIYPGTYTSPNYYSASVSSYPTAGFPIDGHAWSTYPTHTQNPSVACPSTPSSKRPHH